MPALSVYGRNTWTTICFILVASCVISAVAGFGTFQIKILSLDLDASAAPCSLDPGSTASSCKSNDMTCRNNTVIIIKACLSHHQLPLPFSLQCTFGRETLSISSELDGNSKGDKWKSEEVISIPFSFSWSGGFTLSVSASWGCHVQDATEDLNISNIVVADHILPGAQWISFIHLSSSSSQRQSVRHFRSQDRPGIDSSRTINQIVTPESAVEDNKLLGIFRTDNKMNEDTFPMDKSPLHTSPKGGLHSNILANLQSTPTNFHVSPDQAAVSRHIRRRAVDSVGTSELPLVSTSAVVRGFGKSMVMAVRVLCREHYFGNSCSRLCRPRDDILGHYRCSDTGQRVCLQGWSGSDCTEAVCSERCVPSRGRCTSPHTCSCRHGWFGENCERCRSYPGCKHGTCHIPGQCVCHKGWTGPLCDVEELFCLEHKPCQNGGTCLHDGFHNYTCLCPAGFSGTHCEVPQCHDNFCLHAGTCHVAEGTRYCLCWPSFAGPRCQHRLPNASRLPCSGPTCVDKDLQHQSLELQSPCTETSCLSELVNGAPCHNSFCYNRGQCLQLADLNFTCSCPHPFIGPQCLQVLNSCESDPCQNGGTCKVTDLARGLFLCVCMPGYSGSLCDYVVSENLARNTVCDETVVCQNGGHCERWQRSGQFFCKCPPKFTGEFCEINEVNPCSGHLCLNGGSCVVGEDKQPSCVCQTGYTGEFCHSLVDTACSRVVCQNGGTCIEHDGEFVCNCRNKFEGLFCEKRFKRRETALTIRMETLTIRDEKLTVRLETVKSAGCVLQTIFIRLVITIVQSWIVCGILL